MPIIRKNGREPNLASSEEKDRHRTSGKYNFTPAEMEKKGLFTVESIRRIYEENKPKPDEKIHLAAIIKKGKVIGDLTQVKKLLAGLDFSGVDLSGAHLGTRNAALWANPVFTYDETTVFNDEEKIKHGKTTQDLAMEILEKRRGHCSDRQ